jgi:hypothetical protein
MGAGLRVPAPAAGNYDLAGTGRIARPNLMIE